MNNYFLSDDEIAVLSSLMGGTFIYGIESKLFQNFHQSYHDVVKRTLDRLREKQLISLSYDGKMHIQKDIYEMMTILTQPEHLLKMQTTLFSGYKELNYYYKKQQQILHLKKGQQFHQLQIINCLPMFEYDSLDINEALTSEDLQAINDYLDWFDEEGALDYLKNHTHDAKTVMDILNKNYDETQVEYYVWENKKVMNQKKVTVGIMNQLAFEWIKENNDILIQGGTTHVSSILRSMEVKE